MLPLGMVELDVQPLAAFLALRQMLEEQAARDGATSGPLPIPRATRAPPVSGRAGGLQSRTASTDSPASSNRSTAPGTPTR